MLFKADTDPGKEIEVDLDLERGSKWIWMRIWPNVVDQDLDPKPCSVQIVFPYQWKITLILAKMLEFP